MTEGRRAPASRSDAGAERWPLVRAAGEVAWRVLAVAGAVYVVGIVVARLWLVALPLVFALLLTTVLRPPVAWLADRGLPRLLATWIVLVLGLSLVGGALGLAGYSLYQESDELTSAVAAGWEQVADWVEESSIEVSIRDLGESISDLGGDGDVLTRVFSGAVALVQGITIGVLTLFFTFFFVKDGDRLFRGLTSWLADETRTTVREAGERVWANLAAFVHHQALVALINAVITAVILLILGVPLVVPITVLTFIGSFIPFVGPVVAGAAGGLVALADQGLVIALVFLASQFVYQQIEGNVIEPILLGHGVDLHPVVIAASVTSGALVAGLAGAFLAVPLVSAVVTVAAYVRERREEASAGG